MGVLQSLVEAAETRLGVELIDRGEAEQLRENAWNLEVLRSEASDLAYHSLSYFSGQPQELRHETRQRLSQRSRVAAMEDPNAAAEAKLLSNFAFGRGVPVPKAEDEAVQTVIEDAWTDAVNVMKLTGFEAQRHRSLELLTQANLFPTAYVANGYVRVGFLDADTVTHIVCDPEDEERPLWYVTRKRTIEWDFKNDRVRTTDEMKTGAENNSDPKVVYYPHWRNVEDYDEETDGKAEGPPAEKRQEGLVEHIRINRIGRAQFGTPPWAASLRFFRALNDVTEAHVTMAQAASSLIAKQVMRGTPKTLARQANSVLAQTGELGAATFDRTRDRPGPLARPAERPPAPGSFWLENESSKLETLSLNSGAGQVQQTAAILRAPLSASSSFGQHYLGDASNANLATATSLELPTLMAVQAWQETFEQMLSWFTDLVIQEAVRAGRLGGFTGALSESEAEAAGVPKRVARKPLNELRVAEAEDRREVERRTGKSLKYTISMPYPGRRNLPDVQALVTAVVTAFDPSGVNVPLRRAMLSFLATHGLQLDDAAGFVDEVLPEDVTEVMPGVDDATGKPYVDQRSAAYVPPEEPGGPSPSRRPAGREKPRNARETRKPPGREMGESLAEAVDAIYREELLDPLLAGRNGNGAG